MIPVRHYTLGTTLKIYFSYFPCGKKVVCTDALTKVCVCCVCCVLWIAADGSHGW